MPEVFALPRWRIAERIGVSPISGTVTRAMRGRKGDRFGPRQRGLIELRCVKELTLDIEGVLEVNYQITPAGRLHLADYLAQRQGRPLPRLRDADASTNLRYRKDKRPRYCGRQARRKRGVSDADDSPCIWWGGVCQAHDWHRRRRPRR
jgi:hypothetical protein